eukprot:14598294-Ditylum_brightwellii.AAC.1
MSSAVSPLDRSILASARALAVVENIAASIGASEGIITFLAVVILVLATVKGIAKPFLFDVVKAEADVKRRNDTAALSDM